MRDREAGHSTNGLQKAVWIASPGKAAPAPVLWVIGAGAIGFLVSYIGVALAGLSLEWFVLAHGTVSGLFLLTYAHCAGIRLASLGTNWRLGVAGAAAAGAFSVGFVLSQPASPAALGWPVVGDVLSLGLFYGVLDALLLTVLPVHAVWSAVRRRGWLRVWPGWAAATALSLIASAGVTAAYHLGFPEFQGEAIVQPLIGNTVFTLAYLATGSTLAPALSHAAMHVAAVLHQIGGAGPLPPHY